MSDILDDLRDLHKQATRDRSHFYVGKCCKRAIAEIEAARNAMKAMVSYSDTKIAEGLVDGVPELEAVREYFRLND